MKRFFLMIVLVMLVSWILASHGGRGILPASRSAGVWPQAPVCARNSGDAGPSPRASRAISKLAERTRRGPTSTCRGSRRGSPGASPRPAMTCERRLTKCKVAFVNDDDPQDGARPES